MKRVSDGATLPRDKRVKAAMEQLRHDVENSNIFAQIALRHDEIYRERDTSKFQWAKVEGILLGYRLEEDHEGVFKRFVWVVIPGYRLEEIPEKERSAVTTAIFDASLDQGAGPVEFFRPTDDSIMFAQLFTPVFLHERKPNLIVPGGPKWSKST